MAAVIENRASIRTPSNVYHTVPVTPNDLVKDLLERVAWIENTDPAFLSLYRKKRTTAADGREYEDKEDLDPTHRISEYQIVYEREPLFLGWKNSDFILVKSFGQKEKREIKIMCDYIETTLGDLKKGVGAALGLPESRFRLILNKSELKDDNKRLVELGLGGLSNSVFMIERKDAEAA